MKIEEMLSEDRGDGMFVREARSGRGGRGCGQVSLRPYTEERVFAAPIPSRQLRPYGRRRL